MQLCMKVLYEHRNKRPQTTEKQLAVTVSGRDIFVRIQVPDPTPFFSDFKDIKKYFFIFFLITYPQAYYIQS
jgi:hypothetical protein